MEIFINDIVYIYEYKNRNNIKSFKDLIKIKVTDVPPTKDNIVSGYNIKNNSFIKTNNGNFEKTTGIAVFKEENHIILNIKNGKKYFISDNNELKQYEQQDLFALFIVTKLDENVKIKFRLGEMLFDNIENIKHYVDKIHLSCFDMTDSYIHFKFNKEDISYEDYEVYYKDNLIASNYKERLFNYACKHKNAKNKTEFDFNKVFSLKFVEYEISKIC